MEPLSEVSESLKNPSKVSILPLSTLTELRFLHPQSLNLKPPPPALALNAPDHHHLPQHLHLHPRLTAQLQLQLLVMLYVASVKSLVIYVNFTSTSLNTFSD